MEKEIAEVEGATLNEILCTKCGAHTNKFLEERWACTDVTTRAEEVFKTSTYLKSWRDAMTKLARLYCLNQTERQAGFEPHDEILEEGDDYTLLRDQHGLLLIVVHDEETHNMIEKLRPKTPIREKTIHIEFSL